MEVIMEGETEVPQQLSSNWYSLVMLIWKSLEVDFLSYPNFRKL
jgi:hypothetical protein